MENLNLSEVESLLAQAREMLQTTGVDFAINLVTALVIFFVGRLVAKLMVRGLRKVLQRQEVDKTLETFVCNLASMVLLVFVIIAAISAW